MCRSVHCRNTATGVSSFIATAARVGHQNLSNPKEVLARDNKSNEMCLDTYVQYPAMCVQISHIVSASCRILHASPQVLLSIWA